MFSSMSLARTGFNEQERFLNSVRAYKSIFSKWINDKSEYLRRHPVKPGTQFKLDITDMPQLIFEPEPFGQSLGRVLPDIGSMVFLIIAFFAGAYVSFLKYDVR